MVTCALSDMRELQTQRKVLSKRAGIRVLALIHTHPELGFSSHIEPRADYWKSIP
jgi:hypothetical protein